MGPTNTACIWGSRGPLSGHCCYLDLLNSAGVVIQSDVDEALRLMKMSKISLSDEEGARGGIDVISAIYSRIRDDASRNKQATYTWPQLTALFTGKGYSVCSPSHVPLAVELECEHMSTLFCVVASARSLADERCNPHRSLRKHVCSTWSRIVRPRLPMACLLVFSFRVKQFLCGLAAAYSSRVVSR